MDCVTTISLSSSDFYRMQLGFPSFYTETNLDIVTVYSGSTSGSIVTTVSGEQDEPWDTPGIIDIGSSSAAIRFVTDGSIVYDGWTAAFVAADSSCGSQQLFVNHDDSVGDHYGNYANCYYLMAPGNAASSIELKLDSFDLESNLDYIYIYDGATTTSALLATITGDCGDHYGAYSCGDSIWTTQGNAVLIVLTSDVSIIGDFSFRYSATNTPGTSVIGISSATLIAIIVPIAVVVVCCLFIIIIVAAVRNNKRGHRTNAVVLVKQNKTTTVTTTPSTVTGPVATPMTGPAPVQSQPLIMPTPVPTMTSPPAYNQAVFSPIPPMGYGQPPTGYIPSSTHSSVQFTDPNQPPMYNPNPQHSSQPPMYALIGEPSMQAPPPYIGGPISQPMAEPMNSPIATPMDPIQPPKQF
jgi:uncharacterized membrane protein